MGGGLISTRGKECWYMGGVKDGKDGKNKKKGNDGKNEKNGKDEENGKDGKDGNLEGWKVCEG